LTFAFMR